jgi:hypothetical protein
VCYQSLFQKCVLDAYSYDYWSIRRRAKLGVRNKTAGKQTDGEGAESCQPEAENDGFPFIRF